LEAGATTANESSTASIEAVLGRSRRHTGEIFVRAALFAAALLTVITTLGIVFVLASETIAFFGEVPVVDFLFGTKWSPLFSDPQFGVLPLLSGTLQITLIAMMVAIPLGIGSAIYLSEYAHPKVRKVVKPALEVLAGVPTIVFGFFALTLLTPFLQDIGIDVQIFNALSGGLVVGILVLPTIASISEDALRAVPNGLREASFGLGASRRQTAVTVMVPAAASGIIASIVLGISRAIGETMVVLLAAGQVPKLTADWREPMETMTAFIAATGKGDAPTGSIAYKTIFAVGALLFLLTLLLNIVSNRMVKHFREEYE
jgi:phosphate transport system permease protein